MTRTWLPKSHYMPWAGRYRPTYRWYVEMPWALVPGGKSYATVGQAKDAADEYLATAMNRQIRAEKTEARDVLGIAAWHEQKAAQRAAEQEQALGAIVVRSRTVIVERRKARA